MNKNEIFNEIKRLENTWIELLCEGLEFDNVDAMKEKHLRTDEELEEMYNQEDGEDFLVKYKETLEVFIEDYGNDKEFWAYMKEYLEDEGLNIEDIEKVPLV